MSKTLKLLFALSMVAITCCSASHADLGEGTNSKTGAEAPKALQRLVPTGGWKLESFAYGRLTGGKQKDVVMSIGLNPSGAFGDAKARKLIVASPINSNYKIVAIGENALQLGMGPSGGDPFVATRNNEIITEVFGGSAYKYTENYHFAKIGGKWLMTRYKMLGYDSLRDDDASNTTDVNVLTGHVIGTMSREGHRTRRVAFDEVFSLNCIKGLSIPADAPKLRIADRTGRCTASIRSAHSAKEIIVETTVTQTDKTKSTHVCVTDGRGKLIRSIHRRRHDIPNGFVQTLTFALPEENQFNDPENDSNEFLNWIVCVDQTNNTDLKLHNRFSTASAGSRAYVRGGILALTQSSILTLQNVNAHNGSFQSPPIDTPDW